MRYDPVKHALVDDDTGAVIPLAEGDDIPDEIQGQIRGSMKVSKVPKTSYTSAPSEQSHQINTEETKMLSASEQIQRDHDMAMALSLSSDEDPRTVSSLTMSTSSIPVFLSPPETVQPVSVERQRREQEEADRAFALSLSNHHNELPSSERKQKDTIMKYEQNPYFLGNVREETATLGDVELMESGFLNVSSEEQLVSSGDRGSSWVDDLSLARALQAMEFEIAAEMQGGRALTPEEEEFHRKENKASKCKRQLVTISCFLCMVQIGMLVAMIQDDGYASKTENPMYGPSAYTLVRYGAKVAALIKYENEWCRLISPIFLHAGIIHIISNVAIQLRVGGYLELVFGRVSWLFIYFSSGIYGNMLSCIFLPDAVGIGSSGAVLGMLTAWIVWIIFRWWKVPVENRSQRNCQLLVVSAAVGLTLAFSFTDYVDWAAHFGGAIQGTIAAAMMLSREVGNYYLRWGVRTLAAIAFVVSYLWALVYMMERMHPSKEYLEIYDENDDWGR